MAKVTVMGSTGTIGKNVTFKLAKEDVVSEVVLFSRPESIDNAKGQSYDMYDALAAEDIDCLLTPSCNFEDLAGSAIVLITAGVHRKEGMNRRDLAFVNAKIVANYAKQIALHVPDAIILVATNPVDVMTTIALDASGFDRNKVIGVGNHLDSLRLKTYFARRLNINSSEIHTRVIGEHGDNMVPLLSSTTIGGIPLKYFIREVEIDVLEIVKTLRNAGNTIISKKGATEYGPAYAISNLITTLITNTHKILTVSLYLDGEIADVKGVCLGVPSVLSKNGNAMIVPIHMNEYETNKFKKAAEEIRALTEDVRESLKEDD